jgi:hypothetical protein
VLRYDASQPVRCYVPRTVADPSHRASYTVAHIAPGSGIVGQPQDDGTILVYYEGNIYDARNIRTYDDRCDHAFDRMRTNYPTVARAIVNPRDLIDVGTWEPATHSVVTTREEAALIGRWVLGC